MKGLSGVFGPQTVEMVKIKRFVQETTAGLAQVCNLEEMLGICTQAMIHHLDAILARIWVLEPNSTELHLKASAGLYTHLDGQHSQIKVGQYKIGRIAESREPHLSNDISIDPEISNPEWAMKEQIVSFAGYPLVVDDRVVGVAGMFAKKPLSKATIEALEFISVGIAVGIDRKQKEKDVKGKKQAENYARLLLESTDQGVYGLDLEGKCQFINRAASAILGYSGEELVGECMHSKVHHTDFEGKSYPRSKCPIFVSMKQGRGVRIQGDIYWKKDGTSIPVEYSSFPIWDDGILRGVVVTFSDLTERRKLEEQFRQAQKMEAVGRLAGGVAHDFNNLLTVINGYSDIMSNHFEEGDPRLEFLQQIRKAGEKAASLTRQLLLFSRQSVLQPRILEVKDVIEDMEKMLRRLLGEDIILTTSFKDKLCPVKIDPAQLQQAVMNLCVNARDAMPMGGNLTIETEEVELDRWTFPDAENGIYLCLSVTDNGIGMDEITKSRIFEPFFTTKEQGKGTGLGLAMVYGFVKSSGGHIQLYSELGKGTTFNLYFPKILAKSVHKLPQPEGFAVVPGTETILIVEDDDSVRALSCSILRLCGYKVLEANDGPQAIRTVAEYDQKIHLLLTDVVMPQMGGRQLSEVISQIKPGVKTVFCSGYTNDAVVKHGILEDKMPFIHKPYSPLQLTKKIREVLDKTS